MMNRVAQLAAALSVACLIAAASSAGAATVWDLKSDWSETSNPNGPWSYNNDSSPLPHISGSTLPGGAFTSQPGWAACSNCRGFWFQAAVLPPGVDWQLGDIIVHTQDQYGNPYDHEANVTWTSPITGTIDVTGSVWMDHAYPARGNQWNLYVKGELVSSGTLSGTDSYDRSSPFLLSAGSGGINPLKGIHVDAGDIVELQLVRTTVNGYFIGTNLTISAVPENGTVALFCAGLAAITARRTIVRHGKPRPG